MNRLEVLDKLINHFSRLPGVGRKTAQRYAYKIVDMNEEEALAFASTIREVKETVKYCKVCGNFAGFDICTTCKVNEKPKTICVVAYPRDVLSIEKVHSFNGAFHILNGTINPLEGRSPETIRIKELLKRVHPELTEIIVATNPTVDGEATAMYIAKILKPLGIKVSRPAEGISIGTELEYADEVSLNQAFLARRDI